MTTTISVNCLPYERKQVNLTHMYTNTVTHTSYDSRECTNDPY